MKAWMLNDIGDIKLLDVQKPIARHGEVLISIKACGICGSDIPRIYVTGAHNMPLIPGHEFSGVVDAVGDDVSKELIGSRVAVCPKIPCKRCYNCVQGNTDGCTSYDYTGSRRDGAFAEYVAVPIQQLVLLDDNVTFEEGAMLEPLAVAYNAIKRGLDGMRASKDAAITVCGMGTIGLMVVMLLKGIGYDNIYVIGNKDIQRNTAAKLGISDDRFCDIRDVDAKAWCSDNIRASEIYFECVGSNESISLGMQVCGYNGSLVLVGNPRGDMTFLRDIYWNILRSQISLYGIWNSSYQYGSETDDWHMALRLLSDNNMGLSELISHRLAIDDLDEGFRLMRDKSEEYTKVMMINE